LQIGFCHTIDYYHKDESASLKEVNLSLPWSFRTNHAESPKNILSLDNLNSYQEKSSKEKQIFFYQIL
jgi:hypothetical protein